MYKQYQAELADLKVPFNEPSLPYERPELGTNYWVVDNFFPHKNAIEIANRCFNKAKWKLGSPYTDELWPGMRSKKALKNKELLLVEQWAKEQLGKSKLWVQDSNDVIVDSNTAILVGSEEGAARPHTDSRKLCQYGAVLYLSLQPAEHSGTTFYRLKHSNGAAGGNIVNPPNHNLVDALKTASLPKDSWYEDVSIDNKFNRLILFKGNIAHSASSYFGKEKRDKRLAITFFWMAE